MIQNQRGINPIFEIKFIYLEIYLSKGVYIKYVGGGMRQRVLQFFQEIFVAQRNIELNILWLSNFFEENFMAPPINFSFSFKLLLW